MCVCEWGRDKAGLVVQSPIKFTALFHSAYVFPFLSQTL